GPIRAAILEIVRHPAGCEHERPARSVDPAIAEQDAHGSFDHVEDVVFFVRVSPRPLRVGFEPPLRDRVLFLSLGAVGQEGAGDPPHRVRPTAARRQEDAFSLHEANISRGAALSIGKKSSSRAEGRHLAREPFPKAGKMGPTKGGRLRARSALARAPERRASIRLRYGATGSLRSDGRRGRRAQEEIAADPPFVGASKARFALRPTTRLPGASYQPAVLPKEEASIISSSCALARGNLNHDPALPGGSLAGTAALPPPPGRRMGGQATARGRRVALDKPPKSGASSPRRTMRARPRSLPASSPVPPPRPCRQAVLRARRRRAPAFPWRGPVLPRSSPGPASAHCLPQSASPPSRAGRRSGRGSARPAQPSGPRAAGAPARDARAA